MRKLLIPIVMFVTASVAVAAYAVTARVSADRPDRSFDRAVPKVRAA